MLSAVLYYQRISVSAWRLNPSQLLSSTENRAYSWSHPRYSSQRTALLFYFYFTSDTTTGPVSVTRIAHPAPLRTRRPSFNPAVTMRTYYALGWVPAMRVQPLRPPPRPPPRLPPDLLPQLPRDLELVLVLLVVHLLEPLDLLLVLVPRFRLLLLLLVRYGFDVTG